MKFIVCIKQVLDVAAPIHLREGKIAADSGRMVLNAYDASAVEAALVLTESGGGEVHVILAGPARAQETLRKALAMGADSAIHLQIDEGVDLDSRAYAELLADQLRDEAFDVIACGKQAQDTDAGLTGSMLATLLKLPYASNAVGLEINAGRLTVTRQGDAGQEEIRLPTPCLVTCSNDMNDPRIPNLKGIMAAKRKSIDVRSVNIEKRAHAGTVRVQHLAEVPERPPGRIIDGEPDEVVSDLVRLLSDEARVL